MDMATALAELGVTEATLDAGARERLDRDGYLPLPGVLSGGKLTAIRFTAGNGATRVVPGSPTWSQRPSPRCPTSPEPVGRTSW